MKAMRFTVALVATLALVVILSAFPGCKSIQTQNAPTDVFAAQQQYNHALYVADQYGKLPICGSTEAGGDTVFCAKAEIVVKIGDAKDVAGPIIKKAADTVRSPTWNEGDRAKINLVAANALALLTVITDPLQDLIGRAVKAGKASPEKGATASYEMRATPQRLPAANFAVLDVMAVLALLNFLLSKIPAGTAWFSMVEEDRNTLQAIVDEGRVPNDDEWSALNIATDTLEASIDANTERARAYLASKS